MNKPFLFACLIAALPLIADINILAFAGSTRKDSYNKQLLLNAVEIAQQMGATVLVVDLKDYSMPFYDADLEAKGMPKNAKKFRELMAKSDAIIIASPEYNSSIPAVLKNTLDWASRNKEGGSSSEAFKGKKFAIMSTSPGRMGGARGLVHLQGIIEDVGGQVIEQKVSIPQAHKYFSEKNRSENPTLKAEIQELMRLATIDRS